MISPRQYKHLIPYVILAVLGCLQPVRAEPITVRNAALDLHPEQPSETRLGQLRYLGGLILASDDSRFGGYSGLVVDPDGAGLWAVSDMGHWLRLDFGLAEMVPHSVRSATVLPLRNTDGRPLRGKRDTDAEALRRLPDGRWLVAFERWHRVLIYAEPGGAAQAEIPLPPSALKQPNNGGLEAMAVLPGGGLLLFSEEQTRENGDGMVWLRRDGRWEELAWPLRDGFKPTDAALAHSTNAGDDIIVLERYFTPLTGPKARLRRLPAAALDAGGSLPSSVIAEWARPWSVDNMEALDTRRAADGSLWLYLLSDDNGSSLQRTLLLVFRLEE